MQGSTGNLERASGPTHAALTRGTVGAAPAGAQLAMDKR